MSSQSDAMSDEPRTLTDAFMKKDIEALRSSGAAVAAARDVLRTETARVKDWQARFQTLIARREELVKEQETRNPIERSGEKEKEQHVELSRLEASITECEANLAAARRRLGEADASMAEAVQQDTSNRQAIAKHWPDIRHGQRPALQNAIADYAATSGSEIKSKQSLDAFVKSFADHENRADRSADLESKINNLLALVSSRSVAEEQDTANYVRRARFAFKRTAERARRLAEGQVEDVIKLVAKIKDKIPETVQNKTVILENIKAAKGPDPDNDPLKDLGRWMRDVLKASEDHVEAMDLQIGELRKRQRNLLLLRQHVLTEHNLDVVVEEASRVSQALETNPVLRRGPIASAVAVGVLFHLIMSSDQTLLLPSQRHAAVAVVVSLVFVASHLFGGWNRSALMTGLMKELRLKIEEVLNQRIGRVPIKPFRFESTAPAVHDFALPGALQLNKQSVKRNRRVRKGLLVTCNLVAIGLPVVAVLVLSSVTHRLPWPDFAAGLVDRPGQEITLLTTRNGIDCRVANGRLVKETDRAYFLKPGKVEYLADALSPAVGARVVEREGGMRLVPQHEAVGAVDCSENPDPAWAKILAGGFAVAAKDLADAARSIDPTVITQAVVTTPVVQNNGSGTPGATRQLNVKFFAAPIGLAQAVSTWAGAWLDVTKELSSKTFRIHVHMPPRPDEPTYFVNVLTLGDGRQLEHQNAMVLPFFPNRVKGTGNSLDGAFEQGLNGSYSPMPVEQGSMSPDGKRVFTSQRYLQVVADAIRDRVAEGGGVAVDVLGFASSTWESLPAGPTPDELNHALAEGRRAAVLRDLKELIGSETDWDRIWVVGKSAKGCFEDWRTPTVLNEKDYRFKTYGEMKDELVKWVKTEDLQLNEKDITEGALGNFLKRSVVLQLKDLSESCRAVPEASDSAEEMAAVGQEDLTQGEDVPTAANEGGERNQ